VNGAGANSGIRVGSTDGGRAFIRQSVGGDAEIGAITSGGLLLYANNTLGLSFASAAATFASNVGVGVTPSTLFHLRGGSTEDISGAIIRMDLSGLNPYWEIQARNGFNSANRKLGFFTSATSSDVMTLTQAGNVGIGTDNPTANGLMIEKTGNHLFLRASSAAAGKYWNFDITSANQLYIANNTFTQYFTMTDGGNFGINTPSPSTKLHVLNSSNINDAFGLLYVENTNSSSGASSTNSAVNVKNMHGTSQFMQWQSFGLRIGSRILTNGGVGDVIFTAGADSEKMRLLAGGGLTFNGDTAAANALDDYEEGTWTPRLLGGAGGEATYNSRYGWYTKIGRQVTVVWQIYFQKNNMSGTMRMNDLPFTLLSDNSAFYPQGTVLMDTLASVVNNITFQPGNGSNSGDFIQGNGGTLNHEGFSISNLSNTTMLTRGTVTYFTA
jgi:hypothetical protein